MPGAKSNFFGVREFTIFLFCVVASCLFLVGKAWASSVGQINERKQELQSDLQQDPGSLQGINSRSRQAEANHVPNPLPPTTMPRDNKCDFDHLHQRVDKMAASGKLPEHTIRAMHEAVTGLNSECATPVLPDDCAVETADAGTFFMGHEEQRTFYSIQDECLGDCYADSTFVECRDGSLVDPRSGSSVFNVGVDEEFPYLSCSQDECTPEGGSTQCGAERQPPSSMSRATECWAFDNISFDCRSYESFFGGFPGTTNIRHFALEPNQYAAMEFTPDNIPPEARADLNINPLQGINIGHGHMVWSISTCPGDFNPTAIADAMGDAACLLSGYKAFFGFRFGGSDYLSSPFRCGLALDPGTTYYLNIVYTTDDPHTTPSTDLTWTCGPFSGVRCGHQIQPNSLADW